MEQWMYAFFSLVFLDVVILFTVYRNFKHTTSMMVYPSDMKILHCETCGRPEILDVYVEKLEKCVYCTGFYIEEERQTIKLQDKGYDIKRELERQHGREII